MGCVCCKPSAIEDSRESPRERLAAAAAVSSSQPVAAVKLSAERRAVVPSLRREELPAVRGDGVAAEKTEGSGPIKVNGQDLERRRERQGYSHFQDLERRKERQAYHYHPRPSACVPKAVEGEQVAAGWPAWLAAVAGEAIRGWVPRRADSFEKLDKIGQGTYSNVYGARDLDNGKIVALKKVRFDNLEPESVRFMAREIHILRRLDHPNIVKLEGLVTSRMSCSLYLVFEYMEHDLAGLASFPGLKFTEPQIKCYMQQLLRGLDHCHSRSILHRDIKGSNLLIDNTGILKIADFGLASFFDPEQRHPLTSRVVTLWYRPPELLLGATNYGVAVDLWSTGCILAELYAGKPIMPGRTEVEQLHKIFKLCGSPSEDYWRKSKLPHATIFKPQQPYRRCVMETFKDFPASALALMDVLLSIDPADRVTAASALKSEGLMRSRISWPLVMAAYRGLPAFQQDRLRDMGFRSFLEIEPLPLDLPLVQAIRERWDPVSRTFIMPWGHMVPTLEDVARLTGLRVHGRAVTGLAQDDYTGIPDRVIGLPVEGVVGQNARSVSRSALMATFGLREVRQAAGETQAQFVERAAALVRVTYAPDDTDRDRADMDLRRFLFLFFGRLLFVTKGDDMNLRLIFLIEDLPAVGEYAWGAAVLARLFADLSYDRSEKETTAGGFNPLLQLWSYYRFPLGRAREEFPALVPLARRWIVVVPAADNVTQLEIVRRAIDEFPAHDVVWMPYAGMGEEDQPWVTAATGLFGREIWVHCLNEIELLRLRLVRRTLGLHQPWEDVVTPPHVGRSFAGRQRLRSNWPERAPTEYQNWVDGGILIEAVEGLESSAEYLDRYGEVYANRLYRAQEARELFLLQIQLSDTEATVSELEADIVELRRRLRELRRGAAGAGPSSGAPPVEVTELQRQLIDALGRAQEREEELHTLRQDLKAREAQIAELQEAADTMMIPASGGHASDVLEQKVMMQDAEIARLRKELEDARAVPAAPVAEVAQLRRELEEARAVPAGQAAEVEQLRKELAEARALPHDVLTAQLMLSMEQRERQREREEYRAESRAERERLLESQMQRAVAEQGLREMRAKYEKAKAAAAALGQRGAFSTSTAPTSSHSRSAVSGASFRVPRPRSQAGGPSEGQQERVAEEQAEQQVEQPATAEQQPERPTEGEGSGES